MTLKDFLNKRKDSKNYTYYEDYIDDNEIKFVIYWGVNNHIYTKKIDDKMPKKLLSMVLVQIVNNALYIR